MACRYDEHSHERFAPGDPTKRAFTYFVLTGGRFIYASALRLAVLKFILSMTVRCCVCAVSYETSIILFGRGAAFELDQPSGACVLWSHPYAACRCMPTHSLCRAGHIRQWGHAVQSVHTRL